MIDNLEIHVGEGRPFVPGVPGKEPFFKRIMHAVGIGRLPITLVTSGPPPLAELEKRVLEDHMADDPLAIKILRSSSMDPGQQSATRDVITTLRQVLENPNDTDMLRALNRAGAEKFLRNFQSGFQKEGPTVRHKSGCFVKNPGEAGYTASADMIYDKYGVLYSLRYGHATPMVMCVSEDFGRRARAVFYDPISGIRDEQVLRVQRNDQRPSMGRDGEKTLSIRLLRSRTNAKRLSAEELNIRNNLDTVFNTNGIACPARLLEELARNGSFGTDYAFETDQSLVGNFLRALQESKLQRYQHDAQNCVPYSFYAYCLYEALRPGENEFKRCGRDQFSRDFGVFIPTREEIFATLDIRDPVKVLPITVR